MKKALVVGSLNMDLVTQVQSTPKVGETVAGNGLIVNPGGKGANQAVALGKLDVDVNMIGCVGNDEYGSKLKENLHAMNVKDGTFVIDEQPTGIAFIMVNASADNSIVVIEGANGALQPNMVKREWFQGISFLITQQEVPLETLKVVMRMAKENDLMIIHNPAPLVDGTELLLEYVDLLVLNETEFEKLAGFTYQSEIDLANGIEALGVSKILLTLGSQGAIYHDSELTVFVPAKKVKAIDTTAAGDSYIAGVVHHLAQGKDIETAMKFATRVAAHTVTKMGAQASLPFLHEIEE